MGIASALARAVRNGEQQLEVFVQQCPEQPNKTGSSLDSPVMQQIHVMLGSASKRETEAAFALSKVIDEGKTHLKDRSGTVTDFVEVLFRLNAMLEARNQKLMDICELQRDSFSTATLSQTGAAKGISSIPYVPPSQMLAEPLASPRAQSSGDTTGYNDDCSPSRRHPVEKYNSFCVDSLPSESDHAIAGLSDSPMDCLTSSPEKLEQPKPLRLPTCVSFSLLPGAVKGDDAGDSTPSRHPAKKYSPPYEDPPKLEYRKQAKVIIGVGRGLNEMRQMASAPTTPQKAIKQAVDGIITPEKQFMKQNPYIPMADLRCQSELLEQDSADLKDESHAFGRACTVPTPRVDTAARRR